jgi:NAD(P)-dependent dehydrogenase (short-subunit alcohol dehydrogenase family)
MKRIRRLDATYGDDRLVFSTGGAIMTDRHSGRTALVTGGSSGIGQAIACRLAREGANVAIADVADSEETLRLIRSEGGVGFGARCDITDPGQVASFVTETTMRLSEPLILVHSAALQFVRPFGELSLEEWRATQAVNQESMFHLLQAVLPGMKAAQWGRIVVLASSTFFVGAMNITHYVTSKGALVGLVHGLAAEVGPFGVTINALAPGLTRTVKAVHDLPEELFRHVASRQCIKRNGVPEDQAGVVSFLVSDDAAFITGQTILADGGEGRT